MTYPSDRDFHIYKHVCVYEIHEYMSVNDEYGMVGIRDTRIKRAIKEKKPLVIVAPKGSKLFNPKQVKKDFKTFDQVGYYVNDPMKFYALSIPHNGETDLDKWRFA